MLFYSLKDFDCTIETVFGNQELAMVDPIYIKTIYPLLVFKGKSRLCLNAITILATKHKAYNAMEIAKENFGPSFDNSEVF